MEKIEEYDMLPYNSNCVHIYVCVSYMYFLTNVRQIMHVPNVVTLECNLMCNNEDIEFIQIREMSQKVCWMKMLYVQLEMMIQGIIHE